MTYEGATENFAYDGDGLLTGAGAFSITRNAQNGLPESVTDGTATVTRTINGYGEVTGVSTAVNGTTVSWSTTLDNAGRITAKTETVGGTTTTYAYTYDALGHLETVTKNGVLDEDYTVDGNGRRTEDTVASRGIANRPFTYDAEDRMLTAGSASYTYDEDGYLATKTVGSDVTSYVYSRNGALKSVTLPSTDVIEYVLDAGEQRIAKKINGAVTEKYFWAGLTRLLAVYDGSDNLIVRFEYADGPLPVKMVQGGNTYYLAYDQVGSLRAVLNTSGAIVHEITYDSFGNILSETNSGLTIPFGFAGGLHDRDTGLVRFGYRDYDPDTGRWTAKDPLRFVGRDSNLYSYCRHDAVNRIDPLGLAGFKSGFATAVARAQALANSALVWWVKNADVPGPYGSPDPLEWSTGCGWFPWQWNVGSWNNIMDGPQDGTAWGAAQNVSVAVAGTAAVGALGVGVGEVAFLGNQSILLEGALVGGRIGSGGLLQLRVAGQAPWIRLDYHAITWGAGRILHIDSPPLGWHHWPWQ